MHCFTVSGAQCAAWRAVGSAVGVFFWNMRRGKGKPCVLYGENEGLVLKDAVDFWYSRSFLGMQGPGHGQKS